MPLCNRVTPLGELIADPARGLVYGNRGCLHDDQGHIRRCYNGKRWIACRLRFRDYKRERLLAPGRFTELFFLDDATAIGAGHRACALCRRQDYQRLVSIWGQLHPGPVDAESIDAQLHSERLDPATRSRLCRHVPLAGLPDGVFIMYQNAPWLVLGHELVQWTAAGYGKRRRREPRADAQLITPPSLVEVLRAGWEPLVPILHPSALGQ